MTVYISRADVPHMENGLMDFMAQFAFTEVKQADAQQEEPESDFAPCDLLAVAGNGFDLRGDGWELGGFCGTIYSEDGDAYEKEELTRLLLLEEANALYEKMDKAGMLNDLKEQAAVSAIMFVVMAEAGTIDDVTATEHMGTFAEWTPDTAYLIGQIRRWEEKLYRCVQAHTAQTDWTPDAAPALWTMIGDPAEEWPEWSQPLGAHDAYNTGDKCSCDGKHWVSTMDGNVFRPGVYGWEEAE